MYFVETLKQAETEAVSATLEMATGIIRRTAHKIALDEATEQERVDHATAVMVRRACEEELRVRFEYIRPAYHF